MEYIDIFNGDADGICSLIQLRKARPVKSRLVTGVKRNIQLVNTIQCTAGDKITVLDISLDKNRVGLERALSTGAEVLYIDHHYAGDIPVSDHLTTVIENNPEVCTSLLTNQYLDGRFKEWAIVGAFGDNLKKSARMLAKQLDKGEQELRLLEHLGVYMNYNGYGSSIEDLHFHPADLFRATFPFNHPLDFISSTPEFYQKLENGYQHDMASAKAVQPHHCTDYISVYVLPNASWARRVGGVFSNDLANGAPKRAHAILAENSQDGFMVSVRAPLQNKTGADELCRRFPTGGGRKAAAGINHLPVDLLDDFIEQFSEFYKLK